MSAVGGVYKQINKYLQQAKKLDKIEPVIAYYCQPTQRTTSQSAPQPPCSSDVPSRAFVPCACLLSSGRFYAALHGMKIRQTKADTEVVTALVAWCEKVGPHIRHCGDTRSPPQLT